jgi:dihydropyrimidine dehydrogenase (NAD+) subunit PreT
VAARRFIAQEGDVTAAHKPDPELLARFPDLHPPFDHQSALAEANRCLYCFDAPCTVACPTHIDVPRFIKKIAQGNLRGSALTILDANILGASCSRVCPVDVLCEGACVYHRYNKQPIEIGRLQRHAMDAFLHNGASLPKKSAASKQGKVACIGAGPASLACAAELRQQGFSVALFERKPLPGGLNTYGVAEYKLRSTDSLREIEMIRALGVEFRFGEDIPAAALAKLEQEFDAIFLGVGLGTMHKLGIPGEEHPAVINALEFIERYKTGGDLKVGRRVVVIGAGNTAIDAARAARRLGAESVQILYRRDHQHMAAFSFEYDQARAEAVEFRWWTQPIAIHASGDRSNIEAVECTSTHPANAPGNVDLPIGGIESSGKRCNSSVTRAPSFRIPCDMVIPAIGQAPLLSFLETCRGVKVEHGRVQIDRATGQTANLKYFAGGDCVNGGREVVDAVADGKRSALALARILEAAHA